MQQLYRHHVAMIFVAENKIGFIRVAENAIGQILCDGGLSVNFEKVMIDAQVNSQIFATTRDG